VHVHVISCTAHVAVHVIPPPDAGPSFPTTRSLVTPNRCANDLTTAFLAAGALPDGDPFCAAETPGAPTPLARARQAVPEVTRMVEELRRRLR
jgi:hypothetical protein